jgi:uncharacterized protein (DUF58 family)
MSASRSRAVSTVRSYAERAVAPITGLGRLVAAVGVISWVIGWRTGWKEPMIIAAACLFAEVVAYGFTFGRSDLSVSFRLEPKRVVVHERSALEVLVKNPTAHRTMATRMELPIGKAIARFDVPGLSSGSQHDELFSLPTSRRAVIQIGPVRSVRSDPLGLARKEIAWTGTDDLYVHPRIAMLDRLGSGFLRDLEGQTTNDLSNNDVAFHTLREYVPGDDRRHIHWRTTARVGNLMVRQFVDTRRSHLAIALSTDRTEYASADEFELAVSVAGSLGVRTLQDDQTVTVLAGTAPLPSRATSLLLDGLAGVESEPGDGGLLVTATAAASHVPDASIVALITGGSLGLADARVAADRFSLDARVIVIRTASAGTSAVKPVAGITVIHLTALDELIRCLLAASRQ